MQLNVLYELIYCCHMTVNVVLIRMFGRIQNIPSRIDSKKDLFYGLFTFS